VAVYALSALLYRIVNAIHPIRVSEEEEVLGLDISQHDETIYASPPVHVPTSAAAATSQPAPVN
jgi:ammonia channel protein AmtB